MARKRTTKAKVAAAAVVEQSDSVSFQNLGIEWKPRPDGSAELRLAYEGPLASRDEVVARAGTWRQGSGPWSETRELPLMLVADIADDCIRDLRAYHSTWPLSGSHSVRHALMRYDLTERPPEPVGSYHDALAAGDAAAANAAYEPDGVVQEPSGSAYAHSGEDRAAWYRAILGDGSLPLMLGTITDGAIRDLDEMTNAFVLMPDGQRVDALQKLKGHVDENTGSARQQSQLADLTRRLDAVHRNLRRVGR